MSIWRCCLRQGPKKRRGGGGGGGENDLENKYRITKLAMDREVVETWTKKKKKKQAKNKDGIGWVEPLSPQRRGWWAWAACPEAWWVIQIPYALWHMLLEGLGGWLGVGEVGWGEKRRSVRGGGETRGGGRGRAFFFFSYHSVNGGKGCWRVLLHTPYRRTQPPPPGDREREHRKETEGEKEDTTTGDKTQGNTGVRYWRETCV